jgi:hypothetical protein
VADAVVNGKEQSLMRNVPILLEAVHAPDHSIRMFLDGTLAAEGETGLPIVINRRRNDIGRSSYADCEPLKGEIAEVVMFARSLGEPERVRVENYLKTKWSL